MPLSWVWTSAQEAAEALVEVWPGSYVVLFEEPFVSAPPFPLLPPRDPCLETKLLWKQHPFGVWGKPRKPASLPPPPLSLSLVTFILGHLWYLEHTTELQERCISTIFHEIRNPLTGILNTVDSLVAAGQATAPIRQIEESAMYLLTLSTDLFEMHKLRGNQIPIHREPGNVAELIRSVTRDMFPETRVSLHSQVPPSLALDLTKCKQILINLLNNSYKFGATQVWIRVAWKPELLYVEVEDNGQGVARDCFEQIFRAYPGSPNSTGMGIGLSMCRKLLNLLQGEIFVKQSLVAPLGNTGTTIAFSLWAPASLPPLPPPLAPAPAPASAPAPAPAPLQRKVLVVDDNKAIRESIASMLQCLLGPQTISVTTARDGQDAIELWQAAPFTLIFLDLRMPRKDGWAVAREILGASAALPLVFAISAYQLSASEKIECKRLGMAGFIQKPFRLPELKLLLDKIGWLQPKAVSGARSEGGLAPENEKPRGTSWAG